MKFSTASVSVGVQRKPNANWTRSHLPSVSVVSLSLANERSPPNDAHFEPGLATVEQFSAAASLSAVDFGVKFKAKL